MSFLNYKEMRDSNVDWLGQVPRHWGVEKFGYALRERPCYGVLVPDFDPDGIPMLRINDMTKSAISRDQLVTISCNLSQQYSRTIVEPGDVLLTIVGTIGVAIVVDEELKGVNLSRAVARVQVGSRMHPHYARWLFTSPQFRHFTDLTCVGSAQRVLNMSDLTAFTSLLPPLPEQVAIIGFLDRETAKIDALIEEQRRLIEVLKEKRQAVISHAVTKGLNPSAPMKDSGVEWLGKVPTHWEIKAMKRAVVLQRGHDLAADIRTDGTVPVVSSGGISGFHDQAVTSGPTIVTGRYGTIGEFTFVEEPCWPLNTALYSVELHGNEPRFLWFMLQSCKEHFVLNSLKAAVPGVDRNDVHPTMIVMPPPDEQREVANFLSNATQKIDALTTEAEAGIALLRERRAALISAAVTGKIDVRGLVSAQAEAA